MKSINSKKVNNSIKFLALVALVTFMFSSCGGHKLCDAYGGKTNTNSERMAE